MNREMKAFCLLLAVLVTLAVAGVAVASTSPAGVTKRRAELNILNSTKVLARWHLGLIDSKTGSLHSNTFVTCTGRGRPRTGTYTSFTCGLRYQARKVRMLYIVTGRHAFRLRRLAQLR
jgi:hypothetical protein